MSLITPYFESYYNSNAFREQLDKLVTYLISIDKDFKCTPPMINGYDREYLDWEPLSDREVFDEDPTVETPLKRKVPKYKIITAIVNYLTGSNPYGFTIGRGYFGRYIELVLKSEYKPYIEYLLHPQKQDHFIFPEVTLTLFTAPVMNLTPMAYITHNGDRTFIKLEDPSEHLKNVPMYSTLENLLRTYSEIMANTDLPHCVKRVKVNEMVNQFNPITHQASYPVLSLQRKCWTGEDTGLHAYAEVTPFTYLKRDRVYEIGNIFGAHCVVDIEVLSNPIRYKIRLDASDTSYSQEKIDSLESLPSHTIKDTQELTTYIEYTLMKKVCDIQREHLSVGNLYKIKRQLDEYNERILAKLNNYTPIVD